MAIEHEAEVLFERPGFRVTGHEDGVQFQTVGTLGLTFAEVNELAHAVLGWTQA